MDDSQIVALYWQGTSKPSSRPTQSTGLIA